MRFSRDSSSVVGVAWPTEPRRLGLIFCTNRPSYIFSLTLDGVMSEFYIPTYIAEVCGKSVSNGTAQAWLVWRSLRNHIVMYLC